MHGIRRRLENSVHEIAVAGRASRRDPPLKASGTKHFQRNSLTGGDREATTREAVVIGHARTPALVRACSMRRASRTRVPRDWTR